MCQHVHMVTGWIASRRAMERTIAKQADEIQRLHTHIQELQIVNSQLHHDLVLCQRVKEATT